MADPEVIYIQRPVWSGEAEKTSLDRLRDRYLDRKFLVMDEVGHYRRHLKFLATRKPRWWVEKALMRSLVALGVIGRRCPLCDAGKDHRQHVWRNSLVRHKYG